MVDCSYNPEQIVGISRTLGQRAIIGNNLEQTASYSYTLTQKVDINCNLERKVSISYSLGMISHNLDIASYTANCTADFGTVDCRSNSPFAIHCVVPECSYH